MTVIEAQAEQSSAEKPRRQRKLPESNIREVAVRQPQAVQPANPMTVVERAIEKGLTGDDLKQLMDLQERWEANQARKAFDAAVAEAKAEIPVILKNATSHNNKYADFAAIARVVDPVLSRYGLRYRFRSHQTDTTISVTCVLTHKDGHAEENTLTGPVDATVGKNPIQAIGSTLTYLQRYSLVQALGLAASKDDDGAGAGGSATTITALQLHELEKLAAEVNADIPKACKALKIESLAEMPANVFERAKASLEAKRAPL